MLDPEGDRQGAHPDPGHRRVGDVDEVDAGIAQEPGGLDRPLDPDAPRRVDLDRDDELGRRRGAPPVGSAAAASPATDGPVERSATDIRCRPLEILDGAASVGGIAGTAARPATVPCSAAMRARQGPPASRRCARASCRSSRRRSGRRRPAGAASPSRSTPGWPRRRSDPRVAATSPAFGMIDRAGSPSAEAPIASRASRHAAGPAPQLTPMRISARQRQGLRRPLAGSLPSARTSSSPKVSDAMIGTSDARRASSTASSSCSRSEKVSRTIMSAPPSSRPSICSRKAARRGCVRDLGQPATRRTERSDGTADQRIAAAHLTGLTGELRGAPVELADLPPPGPRPPAAGDWPRTTASRSARRPPRDTHGGRPRPSPDDS